MPSKADMIRLLEAELDLIEGGGYGRSVREPWKEKSVFQYSIVCINHWLVPGHDPDCHEGCVLMDFVPEAHKNEALPCNFIPLNEQGETAHLLEQQGDQERLEEVVKQWLRTTIDRLKKEQAELGPAGSSESPEGSY